MENGLILQWEKNKHIIEKWFYELENASYTKYLDIVKFLFENVLKPNEDNEFDVESITLIDDGDYQGTYLFIIPIETYQPNAKEYYVTTVSYGSCSGCDTLQGIFDDSDDIDKQKVEDLMSLALHLVQKTKKIYE